MLQSSPAIEIEQVAGRIERAYLRRRPQWNQPGLDPRVWSAAAAILVEAHRLDPRTPLDPELFVACVAVGPTWSDPWTELTHEASRRRYLAKVRSLIRLLRGELRAEVRGIEAVLRGGASPDSVFQAPSRSTTALGLYLAAVRSGRPDLAARLRADAQNQHWCCPLYREASRGLIPEGSYPVGPLDVEGPQRSQVRSFSLN